MLVLDENSTDYLISLCREAGDAVMEVYEGPVRATVKADSSPVTEADMRSHRLIVHRLQERFPDTPVLSEESAAGAPYEARRAWSEYWLVDPLDGTKEFLKRNGQFTINIALIRDGRPVAGFVYAPATDVLYHTVGDGAFKSERGGSPARLPSSNQPPRDELVIVGSLSHPSPEMEAFVAEQRRGDRPVSFLPMGSSLKICLVAEGAADVYPRFGPTMEWDTAAAHAVANAAGKKVLRHGTGEELTYNKPDLHNDWFVVR